MGSGTAPEKASRRSPSREPPTKEERKKQSGTTSEKVSKRSPSRDQQKKEKHRKATNCFGMNEKKKDREASEPRTATHKSRRSRDESPATAPAAARRKSRSRSQRRSSESPSRRKRSPTPNACGRSILVTNLPPDMSKNELKETVQEFGKVVSIDMKKKSSGTLSGTVEFKRSEEANKAVAKLHKRRIHGWDKRLSAYMKED